METSEEKKCCENKKCCCPCHVMGGVFIILIGVAILLGALDVISGCQRSPQTGQPGSNQTSQSIFVSSHFHSKKLPVTLCYGAFWNENAYFVYANSVAGSIRPFVAGFQVTGDISGKAEWITIAILVILIGLKKTCARMCKCCDKS